MTNTFKNYRLSVIWRKIRLYVDRQAFLDTKTRTIFYSYRDKQTGVISKKTLPEIEVVRIFNELYGE